MIIFKVTLMKKILVVDDEPAILRLLKNSLSQDHYIIVAENNLNSIEVKQLATFDLLILDVMLPGIDGFNFLKKHRQELDCPVILLTAKNQEKDILLGLGIGADDYIVKPFRIAELRARIKAHLRREDRTPQHFIKLSPFKFNLNKKIMTFEEKIIPLTKGEYTICFFLATHCDLVFSKEQIYEHAFGYNGEGDCNSIITHIKNIRRKCPPHRCPIKTIWGIGYLWQKQE